jgi:hypothetical protein
MTIKYILKEKAIAMRREGHTYSEILKEVPVAKSTLTEWFHSVGLAKYENQRLTERKLESAKQGGRAKHQQRLDRTKIIVDRAKAEIGILTKRELWLMGIMLYWAEGSKEKEYSPGSGIQFTNMDPLMICLFLRWLKDICGIDKERLIFDIYVHETHRHRLDDIINFWSQKIKIPTECFSHIYFKKANIKTQRKNIDTLYFGVIKIKVRSSTSLHRQIAGWTQGVVEFFR